MLRFIYVIIVCIFQIIYFVPKMAKYAKHTEKYSEGDKYALAQNVMRRVQRAGRITTEYFGLENIPEDGGYIMYSNHQGKYDALGIMLEHKRPCSVLMDKKRSNMFIAKQFVDLLDGKRLDKSSVRQQISVLRELSDDVRERNKIYLIFPEGGYRRDQDNRMNPFKYGCFKCAYEAKCPILPVTLIDSYKPFGVSSLKKVTTKVVYMPPIPYEEYSKMTPKEFAPYLQGLIQAELDRHTA